MTTAAKTAAPKPKRAYLLRYHDGDMEPCAIVHAPTARAARRQFRAIDNAEYMRTSAERKPEFDAGIPSAADLIAKHGWWFTCRHCGDPVHQREGEPAPVVIVERGDESSVAHAACHAKAEVRA